MPVPFKALRNDMYCAEPRILRPDLARALGCSIDHANRLMNKRADWTMPEMYAALDLVKASPEKLHLYFSREDLRR